MKIKKCIDCGNNVKCSIYFRNEKKVLCYECRLVRRRESVAKFKKTRKGIECEKRWRMNEKKKEIDKKYRQSDRGRKTAIGRVIRYKKKNYEKIKKEDSRLFKIWWRFKKSKSLKLKPWRDWWIKNSKKGCAWCGGKDKLTIDHIIPRIKGGKDELKNFQVLCKVCNGKKGWGRKKTSGIWKLPTVDV